MNLQIEKATLQEVELIIRMLSELYIELGEEQESLNFLTPELISSMMSSGKTEIYLVKENTESIAIFTVTESRAIYAGGIFGAIDEMYVLPGYRGEKVGENIISYIFRIAKTKGWRRVDVTAPTEERWQRTRKFYERNGFVYTGPKYKHTL